MLKSRPEPAASSAAPSVDVLRRQARHRLIGAAVLVLVAVVGFPMVFDTTPRPIAVDVPFVIPAQPAIAPMKPVVSAPAPEPTPAPTPAPVASPPPAPAPVASSPAVKSVEPTGMRFVVQVGAYADQARAREVRLKIERTGLKTYTQVAKTPEGNRIRVRLGPYDSRAEAEKVAQQIKSLGMTPVILTL